MYAIFFHRNWLNTRIFVSSKQGKFHCFDHLILPENNRTLSCNYRLCTTVICISAGILVTNTSLFHCRKYSFIKIDCWLSTSRWHIYAVIAKLFRCFFVKTYVQMRLRSARIFIRYQNQISNLIRLVISFGILSWKHQISQRITSIDLIHSGKHLFKHFFCFLLIPNTHFTIMLIKWI